MPIVVIDDQQTFDHVPSTCAPIAPDRGGFPAVFKARILARPPVGKPRRQYTAQGVADGQRPSGGKAIGFDVRNTALQQARRFAGMRCQYAS